MLIFLWIQIYLSKQRGLTTNGWDADGRLRLIKNPPSNCIPLDEPKIIIYPVNIGVVCMQFCSFSSSHPVNLICLTGWIFFYRATMMDISRNSRLLCEIIKRFWFYGEKKKDTDFFFLWFVWLKDKNKGKYRRTLRQWMHLGFLNQPDLMGPGGPLLHIFIFIGHRHRGYCIDF